MKVNYFALLNIVFLVASSCRYIINKEITNYKYFDVSSSDTIETDTLFAVTDEKNLEYGSRLAYINKLGDTII